MRQEDLTDRDRIERLMDGYISVVREYNALCERVRGLIKNNMVEELERFLNELETPLQEQYKELRQPAVKEFLEMAELYGLEVPALENVFEEIQGTMLSSMGLRPLLIRYRQIARSNNLQAKVALIRQILALNPKDALEWERNLTSFEEEWKLQLQESAKQAILSKDYQELKQIQETILEEPWKTPFNEHVVVKMAQVLEEEEKRAKKRLCEQLIASSESMLSQPGKLKDVTASLAKVNALQMEGSQLDSDWQRRLVTLEENTKKLVAQAAEEEKFAKLFFELEQKMNANAPVEEVDKIFYEMQRLRREIPDITMRRVDTYRQNAVMAAKRKKGMMLVIGLMTAVLLLGAGVVVFRAVSRSLSINEYSARLRTAIDDQAALSDVGYEILKEIETKVPDIRNSKEIASLAEEVTAKRKTEEGKRARFKELQLTLSTQMENYSENAVSIVELMKEIQGQALPEHQKELETLTQLHDERRAKYVRVQDSAYRKLCGDAGDAYIAMKTAMSEHRFDDAREYLPTIAEKLKAANEIPDVSFDAKSGLKNLVEQYVQAAKTLEQSVIDSEMETRLKSLEKKMKDFSAHIDNQQLAMADALCKEINTEAVEITRDIKNASTSLRNQFATLLEDIKGFNGRLDAVRNLIAEEEKALTNALAQKKLQDVQWAIQEFQSKYPSFYNKKEIAKLMDDFSKSQEEAVKEYDAVLHARGQRFNQLVEQVGKGMLEELLKRRDAYIANPVYMLGFTNTQNNVHVDLYLKRTDLDKAEEGVRFDKKMASSLYFINDANVMGLEREAQVRMDLDHHVLMIGNKVSFPMTLDYPGLNDIRNKSFFNSPGYYGTWLLSIKNDSFDFSKLEGWEKLDKSLEILFKEKSDGIRTIHEWLGIMDSVLAISQAFQQGGEFEATELLNLKQELFNLLAILPKESSWQSASWLYQNECSEFYKKLKEFVYGDFIKCGFLPTMKRLGERKVEDQKVLVPCGVMAWRTLDGISNWYFYYTDLPINSEGPLFFADHGQKKSIQIGTYREQGYKLNWNYSGGEDLPKGYYVVFIKK
ncbi:MAG: hypothetical protein IKP00_04130 [Victivallales bacterium]|nr:hypothetical protein [Victivallales bacterium]